MPLKSFTLRAGTTLAELLVALAILGVIASALLRSVNSSIRTVNSQSAAIERRGQLQAAAHVTQSLLSAVSPSDGDITSYADTSVTVRATLGSALVCRTSGTLAEVIPQNLTSSLNFTALADAPKPGDLAALFNGGPLQSLADDHWSIHTIAAVHFLTGACGGTPFTQAGDAAKVGWTLDLSPPPHATVTAVPLRILRPQRLALYHSAPAWMLGVTDWNGASGSWNVIQPVAGPLTGGSSLPHGLDFAWIDSIGSLNPSNLNVASLKALFRAASTTSGQTAKPTVDSVALRIAFRNRQ